MQLFLKVPQQQQQMIKSKKITNAIATQLAPRFAIPALQHGV
jgi:hypothetical protein